MKQPCFGKGDGDSWGSEGNSIYSSGFHITILERHQVGVSFSRWPEEMNFITPSFPSHGFRLLDLNAVTLKTSPAIAFQREHISGKQYALYLQTVADHYLEG